MEDALPNSGLEALSEAFDAALEETGQASSVVEDAGQPPADEQPQPVVEQAQPGVEQPEGESPITQDALDAALLSDDSTEEEGSEPQAVDVNDPKFWTLEVDMDGTAVPLQELRDGYLRQGDYTKKTQELAEQRRLIGDAHDLYERLQADPLSVFNALGVKLGALDASTPVAPVEGMPKFMTETEIQAEVDRRLEEAVAVHPQVRNAAATTAMSAIDSAFAGIERDFEVKLTPEHRVAVMQRAVDAGTSDLRLVFEATLARAGRSNRVAAAAQPRSTSTPPANVIAAETPKPASLTLSEALVAAEQEIAAAAS
jgi:hypothetical protein